MNLFILGVNGISMQGIAKIMQEKGHNVCGYDDSDAELPNIQYSKEIPKETDLIVFSSAIKADHTLMIEAKEKNIPTIQRTDFFIQHMPSNKHKILVAGAHGKTTTASMIAYLLGNKSYYLGGIINNESSSAKFSKNTEYTIIETDESDGSFLKWNGEYKILLNFDYEHMVFYKNKENIKNAYRKFVLDNIEATKIVIYAETKVELEIEDHENIITYGGSNSDFIISNINLNSEGSSFNINNEFFNIPLLGIHNIYNFAAIFALFSIIGETELIENIVTFPGIKKRMQPIKLPHHNKKFFLDYGHHPNEINSVLSSIEKHFNEPFNIIFEPHKPSRILDTLKLWPKTFQNYKVYLYPLFIADEKQINDEILHFSTLKFFNFLKQHNINVELLKEDLSNLQINEANLICFSAGKLSEILSKY